MFNSNLIVSIHDQPRVRLYQCPGSLSPSHAEWIQADKPPSPFLAHKFSLTSAYAPLSHPQTHAEDSFKACIDFIYHSHGVAAVRLLQLPSLSGAAPVLLPTDDYPSDHLMIAMQFTFV